jgi:hypothetical protein
MRDSHKSFDTSINLVRRLSNALAFDNKSIYQFVDVSIRNRIDRAVGCGKYPVENRFARHITNGKHNNNRISSVANERKAIISDNYRHYGYGRVT